MNAGHAALSTGHSDERFDAVRFAFDNLLLEDRDYSAQLAVYWNGELVVDLAGGRHLGHHQVTGLYSVSKGLAGILLARLIEDGIFDLDAPVSTWWPEFAAHGKDSATLRELCSHQVGVVGVDAPFTLEEYVDTRLAARRLAQERPSWRPGTAFGYHQRTLGIALEELVRRATGERLQTLYEERSRAPYEIDAYLGFPRAEEPRFVPVLPDDRDGDEDAVLSTSWQGVARNAGGASLALAANIPELRASGLCSSAGVGSAEGIARAYACATTGVAGAEPFLSYETVMRVSEQQVWGIDRVSEQLAGYGIVFQKPTPLNPFGGQRSFGHDGAGGALGFADPSVGLAFGYVPAPYESPSAGSRGSRLAQAVQQCLQAQGGGDPRSS